MKQSNIDFAVNSILRYAITMIGALEIDEYIEIGKIVGDALGSTMLSEFKKFDDMRKEQMKYLMEQNALLKQKVEKGVYVQNLAIGNMLREKDWEIHLLNEMIENKREAYKKELGLLQEKYDRQREDNMKLQEIAGSDIIELTASIKKQDKTINKLQAKNSILNNQMDWIRQFLMNHDINIQDILNLQSTPEIQAED